MDVYWLEQRQENVPLAHEWLSRREDEHLTTLRFEKRRNDWLLGRWTAKQAAAAFLALPVDLRALANIEIEALSSGAPEVQLGGRPAAVSISISHRNGRALCTCAEAQVDLGCDLEMIEPRGEGFTSDYFTLEEQTAIAQAPVEAHPLLVTLFWSAKESTLKALRVGLRANTRSVQVQWQGDPAGGAGWSVLRLRHLPSRDYFGWWRVDTGSVRTIVSPFPLNLPTPLTLHATACCS